MYIWYSDVSGSCVPVHQHVQNVSKPNKYNYISYRLMQECTNSMHQTEESDGKYNHHRSSCSTVGYKPHTIHTSILHRVRVLVLHGWPLSSMLTLSKAPFLSLFPVHFPHVLLSSLYINKTISMC